MKHFISIVFAVVLLGFSCTSNPVDALNNSEGKITVAFLKDMVVLKLVFGKQ